MFYSNIWAYIVVENISSSTVDTSGGAGASKKSAKKKGSSFQTVSALFRVTE